MLTRASSKAGLCTLSCCWEVGTLRVIAVWSYIMKKFLFLSGLFFYYFLIFFIVFSGDEMCSMSHQLSDNEGLFPYNHTFTTIFFFSLLYRTVRRGQEGTFGHVQWG